MALIEIASFQDPITAEMARGRLAAEGIDALLLGAGVASLGLGALAPIQLMVDARDRVPAERALANPSA